MDRSYNPDNMFEEAGKFLRSKLNMEQFEKELVEFFKEKNMTLDEQNLFSYHMQTQFQLTLTVARIKSGMDRHKAEKKKVQTGG